jgi:hypothetical protein
MGQQQDECYELGGITVCYLLHNMHTICWGDASRDGAAMVPKC